MSNNKRLRRLIRNLGKDKSWIEITDTWIVTNYDSENVVYIQSRSDTFKCVYGPELFYKIYSFKQEDKYVSFKYFCFDILSGDYFYTFKILEGYTLERNGTDVDYYLKYDNHTIRIRRLTKQECLDKRLIKEKK